MPAALPPGRGTPYRIGLVCLGNICRSPMAAVVLGHLVGSAGLAGAVVVDSCGTGAWHVGEPIDRRAAAALVAAGYDPSTHRARTLDPTWADRDVLLAMDGENLAGVRAALEVDPARVLLFRDFDPVGPGDVPDPFYGGADGFEDVLAMVERTAFALVEQLPDRQSRQGPDRMV